MKKLPRWFCGPGGGLRRDTRGLGRRGTVRESAEVVVVGVLVPALGFVASHFIVACDRREKGRECVKQVRDNLRDKF